MATNVVRSDTSRIYYTNAGTAITAGTVVQIGSVVGVALVDIANGASGACLIEGEVTVPKATGTAWTVGQIIYWDTSAGECTHTDDTGTNKRAGIASSAAASGAATGTIILNKTGGVDSP